MISVYNPSLDEDLAEICTGSYTSTAPEQKVPPEVPDHQFGDQDVRYRELCTQGLCPVHGFRAIMYVFWHTRYLLQSSRTRIFHLSSLVITSGRTE
jgi:hypothetical protein